MTIINDSIEEMWVLRRNKAKKTVKCYNKFLGMRYWTSNSYTAPSYYVKPVSSNASEIKVVRQLCQDSFYKTEYQTELKKRILELPEDAQWEIQRLTEDRDKACSNDHVKRSWRVVAFQQKPRRQISPEFGRRWFGKNKQLLVEWVLVLRGETQDYKSRTTPSKHDDPWNPKPKPVQLPKRVANPCPPPPLVAMAPAGAVLRHVENRRVISTEEAEKKMEEIVRDLFKYEEDGKENDAAGKYADIHLAHYKYAPPLMNYWTWLLFDSQEKKF
jgi:hypothetical protein